MILYAASMAFELSEEQRELAGTVDRLLADSTAGPRARQLIEEPDGWRELWDAVADLGVLAMAVPEEHGGLGLGPVELVAVAEAVGRHLAPGPIVATAGAFVPVLAPLAAEHPLAAQALAEVAERSATGAVAAADPRSRAPCGDAPGADPRPRVRDGRLSVELVVPDAAKLDWLALAGRRRAGRARRSCCWSERSSTLGEAAEIDPSRPLARVRVDGLDVRERLLPAPSGPLAVAHATAAAELVGLADALLRMSVAYAGERQQFGAAIGSFQALKHRLADVLIAIERARSHVWHAAVLAQERDACRRRPPTSPTPPRAMPSRLPRARRCRSTAGSASRASTTSACSTCARGRRRSRSAAVTRTRSLPLRTSCGRAPRPTPRREPATAPRSRPMPAERQLASADDEAILAMVRDYATAELAPRAAQAEEQGAFPRETFRELGRLGLLGMPYPEELGGGGQRYEVYLQALEELASAWASVAVGVSVHVMSCMPLATVGSEQQRERWLPELLGGELLGAYCLSEAHAGSDPAAMRARARRAPDGDAYVIDGSKAWVTHGGEADFYTLFARTSDDRTRGISCFLVPADADGLSAQAPERKMGLTGSRTSTVDFDGVHADPERLIGGEGDGLGIALGALDSGRLGIAAVAVGVAQAALDHAVAYARERESFGQPIIRHQGLAFMLADMAAATESARATMLAAARRRDARLPYSRQASIAKLVATDAAMKVTTDAVQVLGGAGYTREFPVERLMREAKVMQIFEGTNQIQRMVIARHLERAAR